MELYTLLTQTQIELVPEKGGQFVYLDGNDVTDEIRS